jgi:hypothetical protein
VEIRKVKIYLKALFISETHLINFSKTLVRLHNMGKVKKVKQSLYTPWRRLGGEEV